MDTEHFILSVFITLYMLQGGMKLIPPCIPDSYPYRITSTKCPKNTVVSPDDGHIVTRNMKRKEINIPRKIVHQVCFMYNTGSK